VVLLGWCLLLFGVFFVVRFGGIFDIWVGLGLLEL